MGMGNFLNELEKRSEGSPLFEASDAMSVIEGASGDWWYVPTEPYFNRLMRVAIHEVSANSWEILYCKQGSPAELAQQAAAAGGADIEPEMNIDDSMNRIAFADDMISESVEGDAGVLKGWTVVEPTWKGEFGECLLRCVAIVQGDKAGAGADMAKFQQA
jgi:hypothetical protein